MGKFLATIHKYIFYFNPDPDGNPATDDDAGTQDGTEGFKYCGDVLKQPPQTPIYLPSILIRMILKIRIPSRRRRRRRRRLRHCRLIFRSIGPLSPPVIQVENWIQTYFRNIKNPPATNTPPIPAAII